jgi:uncharacterized protein (DUF3084 family)
MSGEMTSGFARMILDDLETEFASRMQSLRQYADQLDQIDQAIEDKRRELAGLHPDVQVRQRELARIEGEFARIKDMLSVK